MVEFSVDREDLINALEDALEDVKNNTDANVFILLKLYIVRGIDYDGDTYENEVASISTILFTDNDSELEEKVKNYRLYLYEVDIKGQELYDFAETDTFEGTIVLSKETIEKMLNFLRKFQSTPTVEILHSKYVKKSYIKCDDKMMRLWINKIVSYFTIMIGTDAYEIVDLDGNSVNVIRKLSKALKMLI